MLLNKKIICLFLILAAVSCAKQPVVVSETAPTSTAKPTVTSAIPPTATLQKTPTLLVLTPTPTTAEEKVPTFLPTLPTALAQEQVLELIKTNGNCDLPCWWGLWPGEATYEEVNQLLSPLIVREPHFIGDIPQDARIQYAFPVSLSVSVLEEIRIDMWFERSKLQYIIEYPLQWEAYSLPSLLRKYGPPEQVLISTQDTPPGIPPHFDLFLFYPQKGILAYYGSNSEKNEIEFSGTIIRGCFSRSAYLYLWSPDEQLTLEQVAENMSVPGFDEAGFLQLPLDQATGMDSQRFHQTYKDLTTMPCIQTPKNLWPKP